MGTRFIRTLPTWKKWDMVELSAEEEIALMTPVAEEDAWAEVGELKFLTAETLAILTERAAEWHRMYPYGEPQFKRYDGYVVFLHTCDLAEVLNISMRKAQKMLQIARNRLNKDKSTFVSVKEFCFITTLDEEEFRKGLSLLE